MVSAIHGHVTTDKNVGGGIVIAQAILVAVVRSAKVRRKISGVLGRARKVKMFRNLCGPD